MKPQKRSTVGTLIVIKIGWLPLVSYDEVKRAIAIHISHRDSPADVRFVKSNVTCKIVVTSALCADEEWVVLMSAKIITRLKAWPTARLMQKTVIPHCQLLQFRPAVDVALHEPCRLDGLGHTVIVEVGQFCLPCPSATR